MLSAEEKKELLELFFTLYNYMVRTFELNAVNAADMRDDLLRRIRIADHSNQRALRKYIFRMLRDLLPITIRHRLKSSRIGYFFAKRI